MSVSAWEAIFMLFVLKIPVIYLAVVVLWAVRAVPEEAAGEDEVRVLAPLTPCGWSDSQRRRSRPLRRGPFGPPSPRVTRARAS